MHELHFLAGKGGGEGGRSRDWMCDTIVDALVVTVL